MNATNKFFSNAQRVLNEALTRNEKSMEEAAWKIANCLINDGLVYAFGTGHAHILVEELFYRAGGLAAVYPILDERLMLHINATGSSKAERTPGYAAELIEKYPIKSTDVMIVCSNSGRNAAPVEMAAKAKERGVYVIALTNMEHSKKMLPNNPIGMRLYEVADCVLDNAGCLGDAAISIGKYAMGATSTMVGAALLQALTCRAAEIALERGQPLKVFISGNVEGGDDLNRALLDEYKGIVHCL